MPEQKRPRGRPRKEPDNQQTKWTEADNKLLADLIKASPVKDEIGKERFARRAVEADRQCRELDAMIRNPDEQRALNQAQRNFRSCLDRLHIAEDVREVGDDEDDGG